MGRAFAHLGSIRYSKHKVTSEPKNADGIWYWLKSADRYLYHYTTAATLCDHILARGELRFSSFERLNDPYEFKSLKLTWVAGGEFGPEFTPTMMDDYAALLRRDVRVACFSSDLPGCEMTGQIGPVERTERVYQRGHSLPQMWAHYGDNHAGACLVFDRAALVAAVKAATAPLGLRVLDGRVSYENWPAGISSDRLPRGFWADFDEWTAVGPAEMARRHIEREADSLFLAKTKAWQGEQEYRLLLWGAAPPYVHLQYSEALVGIMLGERFSEARRQIVDDYCHVHSVKLSTMRWMNGLPQPQLTWPDGWRPKPG